MHPNVGQLDVTTNVCHMAYVVDYRRCNIAFAEQRMSYTNTTRHTTHVKQNKNQQLTFRHNALL